MDTSSVEESEHPDDISNFPSEKKLKKTIAKKTFQKVKTDRDHFMRLPDEQIVHILSYVGIYDIAMNVSLVNQRLHRLCSDCSLWRNSILFLDEDLERSIQILSRCPQLERLFIADDLEDVGKICSFALQHCPKLEELNIIICPDLEELLKSLATFGGSLTKLTLEDNDDDLFKDWNPDVFEVYAESLKNLKHIEIESDCIKDGGLRAIADRCSQLEHFSIPNKFEMEDGTIRYFIDKVHSRIKAFEFVGDEVTNTTFTKLGECLQLEILAIFQASMLEQSGLRAISDLSKLHRLVINNTILKMDDFVQAFSGNKLTKIDYLEVINSTGINDQVLMAITNNCPSLRYFDVRVDNATNEGLKYVLQNCLRLNHFYMTNLKNISMEAFEDIRAPVKHLRVSRSCINLTDGQLSEFQERYPEMEIEGFQKE